MNETKHTADGHALRLIYGTFRHREQVLVEIDGKTVKRNVCFDPAAGDLYILVNGRRFYYAEIV